MISNFYLWQLACGFKVVLLWYQIHRSRPETV